MVKRLAAVFLAAVTVALLLGGCNANIIESVDSLMVPPVFYEEYEDLVSAFKSAVGEDITFCPPVSGEHRSAIIFNDMDGDGADEALVFYVLTASRSSVRMHYLDISGGSWVSVADFAGYGVGVESVSFEDFNSSGFDELLVTWSIYAGSSSRILSVYKSVAGGKRGVLTELTNITFNAMLTADIDGDGGKEIFYIDQTSSAGVSQRSAKLLKVNDESVAVAGETKLDGNVSGYVSIKTEKASADMPFRIYADALKGETQMITEVVYWDKKSSNLVAPLLDGETLTNSITLRGELITSRDINGDGVIDIPTQPGASVNLIGSNQDITDVTAVRPTQWINLTSSGTKTVLYSFVNCERSYMVTLEADEAAKLSARSDKAQNAWVFYESGAEGEVNAFTLVSVPVGEEISTKYSQYPVILSNAGGLVVALPGDSGSTVSIDPATRISGLNAKEGIDGGA